MATSTIKNTVVKKKIINYVPAADLAAGSYGYFTIPNDPDIQHAQQILSTSFVPGHPGIAGGYSLTGCATNIANIYVSYYSPRYVAAANADFDMHIAYI